MLSVVMLSVIMLSVIMLSVIMLSVVMLSVVMLSVVMLSVMEPSELTCAPARLIVVRGQCYKAFYGPNVRIFVIS